MLRNPWHTLISLLIVLLLVGAAVPSASSCVPRQGPSSAPRDRLNPVEPQAPDSTLLGVVWTPPTSPGPALQDLQRIHEAGATAVRLTRPPEADTVFALADSLGLRLFVDLPVEPLSPPPVPELSEEDPDSLSLIRSRAQQHPSLQYVGRAGPLDTTVPTTCEALEAWSDRVHARSDSALKTYYLTPFPASADRCADAVDRPLLDVRGHPSPVEHLARWQADTPSVGLGALGTWVRPGTPSGLRVPHSPQRQARYLERALTALLDSAWTASPVLFVSRWRDRSDAPLPSRRYGLHRQDASTRPAAKVMRGVFTGTQRVFAFPTGSDPVGGHPVLFLVAWGLLALLGGLYARWPFVRRTVGRYFTAHGFYRDALRDGRDLSPGINLVLLGMVAVCMGLVGTLLARAADAWYTTEFLLAAVPTALQGLLAGGIEHSSRMGLAVGGGVLGLLLLWTAALVLMARRRTVFSPSQGLMLVVWPCWPVFPAVAIALVVATTGLSASSPVVASLFAGSGIMVLYVTARTLADYRAVTAVSPAPLVLLGLLSPPVLTVGLLVALAAQYDLPLRLLWHLLTLT